MSRGLRGRPTLACIAALLALSSIPACVTEKKRSAAPTAPLPAGPVATPAGRTTSFHIRVEVTPVGTIPYDGVVLPLISPDGRFAAAQSGEPPTWPTLMAEMAAEPPPGTRLAVYDLTARPIERISWPEDLPQGLVLGRASDDGGFLVEAPQPDGSRWVGKAAWLSGRIEWLVRDSAVNAHAVLTRTGDLLFTRRAVDAERAELVLHHPDGTESVAVDPSGSYAYPMTAGDPLQVFALVRTPGRLEIESIHLVNDPPDTGPARLGSSRVRRAIASSADPALAFQVAAPVAAAPPLRADDANREGSLLLFHPGLKRMALFDPVIAGFHSLAPQSIAAIHWSGPPGGFFCTTPVGLVFTPDPRADDAPARRPDARVLADPYVPRATTDPARPVILFGPNPRDPERLLVHAMSIPGAAAGNTGR